ncbi:MAG TPA: hypothetical protein VNG51_12185 [Ktedonobacteraceae bacterium]|nr:hypothetical protein [Ktedonobacteraceae bacterium]
MSQQTGQTKNHRKRRLFALLLIIFALLLASAGIWTLVRKSHDSNGISLHNPTPNSPDPTPAWTSGTQIHNGTISPLIFGTNMSLYDSSDQFLNSPQTQAQLQHLHMRIIRMPVRASLSNQTEIQAAIAIRNVQAIPLVILRGAVDATALADDTRIVNDMNTVFGNGLVYYEYGNEEDLLGVNALNFVASWNTIVPQLKRIARHAQFIGPVTSQYEHDYLTTFLQQAKPRPDAISWHEYTCDDSWSNALCIARISNWTNHITDARKVMTAILHTTLPIMITEWNYAPNAQNGDGKINDSSFMSTWTTKALETLAANHVFASMQYTCTNSVYALVNGNNTLSAQGITMQKLYQQMVVEGKSPAQTG